MGIVTPSTDNSKYPLWHCQPQYKTPGLDIPQPYTTPKEMSAAGHDAMINKELGSENVYDPLQSRNASPTPGPQTLPVYGEDTATIPPIHIPTLVGYGDSGIGGLASGMASPVTKRDARLLDGLPRARPWNWDCHGLLAPAEDPAVACLCPWAHLLYPEPDMEES